MIFVDDVLEQGFKVIHIEEKDRTRITRKGEIFADAV